MIEFTGYKTFDGVLHEDKKHADNHLDKMYGDKLCFIAAKMCSIDKYRATGDFINDHLDDFQILINIKTDMEVSHA